MKGKKTGGRQKGTPNKTTGGVRAYALQFTQEMTDVLVAIARNTKASASARAYAANCVLDRAVGKPAQALTGADDTPLIPPKTVYELHLPGGD